MREIINKKLTFKYLYIVVSIILFAIAITIFREYIFKIFGASLIFIFSFITSFLYILLFKFKTLIKTWKIFTSIFFIGISIITFIGITSPINLYGVEINSLGGELSILMARKPFYWNQYDYSYFHIIQSFIRGILLISFGLFIIYPKFFTKILKKLIKKLMNIINIILSDSTLKKINQIKNKILQLINKNTKIVQNHKDEVKISKNNTDNTPSIKENDASIWNNSPEIKAPKNEYSSAIKFNWKIPDKNILEIAPLQGVSQSEINETKNLIEKSLKNYVRTAPDVKRQNLKI